LASLITIFLFRNGEGIEYLENPNQFDAKTLELSKSFEIKSEMSFSKTFQKKMERRKAANTSKTVRLTCNSSIANPNTLLCLAYRPNGETTIYCKDKR
jgi:hypothetical protein